MNGGGVHVGVFDKEFQSTPVNCKADRLSAFCTSRAKTSAIRTRHDKTTLLVTKGDNGHFRTLRAITYKKILNKSNAVLAACLHLFATFGLECRAFACKKNHLQKSGGGGKPPCPSPSAAYERQRYRDRERKRDRHTQTDTQTETDRQTDSPVHILVHIQFIRSLLKADCPI